MGYLRRVLCDHPATREFEKVVNGLRTPRQETERTVLMLANGKRIVPRAERYEVGEAKRTVTVRIGFDEAGYGTTSSADEAFEEFATGRTDHLPFSAAGHAVEVHKQPLDEPPKLPRRRYALPAVAALTYLAATAWTSGAQMVAVGLFVWVLLFLALWLRFPERLRSTPVTSAALAPAQKSHSLGEWFSPTATCPECNVDCEHRTEVHDLDPERDDANTIGRRCRCGHRWAQRASL